MRKRDLVKKQNKNGTRILRKAYRLEGSDKSFLHTINREKEEKKE